MCFVGQNGSLRTIPENEDRLTPISVLYPTSFLVSFSSLQTINSYLQCNRTEQLDSESWTPQEIAFPNIRTDEEKEMAVIRIGCRADIHWFNPFSDSDDPYPSEALEVTAKPIKALEASNGEQQKEDTFWTVVIIVASIIIFVSLVFIAVAIIVDRKRTQLARM